MELLQGDFWNCTVQKESAVGVILVHIFPAFSHIRSEYGEILRISPYSVRMRENPGKCGSE